MGDKDPSKLHFAPLSHTHISLLLCEIDLNSPIFIGRRREEGPPALFFSLSPVWLAIEGGGGERSLAVGSAP